jgi:hypothetical protein
MQSHFPTDLSEFILSQPAYHIGINLLPTQIRTHKATQTRIIKESNIILQMPGENQVLIERIVFGVIAIGLGLVLCFAGYRLFRILIAIWGFFVGFLIGSQVTANLTGTVFLGTVTSWVAGLLAGLVLAALAYTLYKIAIILLGASLGYTVGAGVMVALGFDPNGFQVVIAGLVLALVLAVLILKFNLVRLLIIINTALSGANILLIGVLVLLNRVPLEFSHVGLVGGYILSSLGWTILWLAIAAVGIAAQASRNSDYRIQGYSPGH